MSKQLLAAPAPNWKTFPVYGTEAQAVFYDIFFGLFEMDYGSVEISGDIDEYSPEYEVSASDLKQLIDNLANPDEDWKENVEPLLQKELDKIDMTIEQFEDIITKIFMWCDTEEGWIRIAWS